MTATAKLPSDLRLDDFIAGINGAHAGELERLAGAMLLSQHLGDLADHLVGHYVDQARRAGRSWTEIGSSMGVTKQAVRKRFNPKDPGQPQPDAADGFANFTEEARNAVVQSQEEARRAGNAEIGTPHLLLALLLEAGPVSRCLESQHVCVPDLVASMRAGLDPAADNASPALIPYDEPARKVLELCFREALRLEHAFVGPEHMLLALLVAEDGTGPLAGLDLERSAVEAVLIELIQPTLVDE